MASYLPTPHLMASEFRRGSLHPWGLRALLSLVAFTTCLVVRDAIPGYAFFGMGASATLAFVYARAVLDGRRRFQRAWGRFTQPVVVEIGDDRLEMRHEFGSSLLLRTGVESVLESPHAFVLTLPGGTPGITLPKTPLSPEDVLRMRGWTKGRATPSSP